MTNSFISKVSYGILNGGPLTGLPRFLVQLDVDGDNQFTADHLHELLLEVAPFRQLENFYSGLAPVLTFSGRSVETSQAEIAEVLTDPKFSKITALHLYSSCTTPLSDEFMDALSTWSRSGKFVCWTNMIDLFGDKAMCLRPDVALSQIDGLENTLQNFEVPVGDQSGINELLSVHNFFSRHYRTNGFDLDLRSFFVLPLCKEVLSLALQHGLSVDLS